MIGMEIWIPCMTAFQGSHSYAILRLIARGFTVLFGGV